MKIYALSTLGIGADTLKELLGRMPITGVIGLTERAASDAVAGYVFMRAFCTQHDIAFVPIESYSLSSDIDRQRLLELEMDLLLVLGWQRLVPDWLIRHSAVGVVGVHGSWAGITGGRGRSPQTWSLLMGKTQFSVSIFWIDQNIDAGDVIDTRVFSLTEFDDIQSSNHKVSMLVAEMLIKNFQRTCLSRAIGTPQDKQARYLPQRTPEDGCIDWTRSLRQIYDFIRAQTRPYAGAYSLFAGGKLIIWRARPFDIELDVPMIEPGTIVRVFDSGDLVIKTGSGLLLVDEYAVEPPEAWGQLSTNLILDSAEWPAQMAQIVKRHQAKYPDLEIVPEILAAAAELQGTIKE